MKKNLGIITSLLVLCTAALCWTGCSRTMGYADDYRGDCAVNDCNPRRVEPCREPCREPVRCAHPSSNRICTDGVIVTASQPQLCILGDNYALDLCVQACIDVCSVEVNAMIPEGVSLIRTEPENSKARQENGRITWNFDHMRKGETRYHRILLRADREGDLCICFCVTAVPVQFCSVLCAKPVLECSKCGPEEVCPGDAVNYVIEVTNRGSCDAEDVVVTDEVPDGLEHSSGLRTLSYRLGTLRPCETKRINVCFCAVKRGKICNSINVTACNASAVSCQACTCVCVCECAVKKNGPKERSIGESADYEIVVTNPGDKPLTDVAVVDQAPAGTSIVEARGAQINGNQAVWRFDELRPGDTKRMVITLTTCTPGYCVNRVYVENCQRCCCSAEAGTRWRGSAALSVCFTDTENPICVGDFTCYKLLVTNQGTEEDTNLKVVVHFPANMVPVSAYGDVPGQISGGNVNFSVNNIGPRETREFIIKAQGKEKGEARVKAEISSDTVKTPILTEESTLIF